MNQSNAHTKDTNQIQRLKRCVNEGLNAIQYELRNNVEQNFVQC